jgi:DNA-binding XRE family transcriptional regulator
MPKSKLNAGAAKLRIWLVKHGVAQDAFAKRVGVVPATIINYCAGRFVPNLETASKIANETDGAVQSGDWITPYTGAVSKVPTFRRGYRASSEAR